MPEETIYQDDSLWKNIGLVSRTLLDMETMRMQISLRMDRARKDGRLNFWKGEGVFPGDAAVEGIKELEHKLDLELTRLMRLTFMRDWIDGQKGIGLLGVGLLIGYTSPLDNFATVSKLWKYCGYAVDENGATQKRAKGQTVDYTPMARVICHRIAEAFHKSGKGGPYREAYDRKRAEYLARPRLGESQCPMSRVHKAKGGQVLQCVKVDDEGKETSAHIHAAALRYAVKCFLRDFWEEWHRRRAVCSLISVKSMPAADAAD